MMFNSELYKEKDTKFVLKAGRIIEDPNDAPAHDRSIVIEDGEVAKFANDANVLPTSDEYLEVDLSTYTLLPGLLDAHVHAVFSASPEPLREAMSDSDDMLVARGIENCACLISSGVLTVRDCGAPRESAFRLRKSLHQLHLPYPSLLLSGRPITTFGGHFFWCGEQADTNYELRQSVEHLAAEGADWIKIMASGGNMTPGSMPAQKAFPASSLKVVVREAHRLGLGVAAHCLARESLLAAIQAKVDTIEHCMFLVQKSQGKDSDCFETDTEIIRRIADAGIYVVPTLSAKYRSLDSERGQINPDPVAVKQIKLEEARFDAFRSMVDLGVRIVAGTDSGVSNTPFTSLSLELQIMVDNGLSPAVALQSATSLASNALGVPGVAGRLGIGMPADLIAVKQNPQKDISTVAQPVFIMKAGRIVYIDEKIKKEGDPY